MQQRQLRLGDILDDYCPRERRVTNHAVVAMVGPDVKQTRCTTCDAEHEYKHAKIPRQRRKADTPAALYSQVLASGPKRVTHDGAAPGGTEPPVHDVEDHNEDATDMAGDDTASNAQPQASEPELLADAETDTESMEPDDNGARDDEGPVHRPLIRASLPRPEGQAPPARPLPEFTIRQPGGGRPSRFRPRHQRGGQPGHQFSGGNRSNGTFGGGQPRGMRPGGGRPPQGAASSRLARRHGPGRKRSK